MNGYVIRKLDNIFRVDVNGQYEQRLSLLYKLQKQQHEDFFKDKVVKESNLFREALIVAKNNGLVVRVCIDETETQEDIAGFVMAVGDSEAVISTISFDGFDNGKKIIWRDTTRLDRFTVSLAAADDATRARLNVITPKDLWEALALTFMNILSAFIPMLFALGWLMPGYIILGIAHALALTWSEHHPKQLFLLATAVYLVAKLWVVMDSFFSAYSLSMMPGLLANNIPVRWITVLATMGVALGLSRGMRFEEAIVPFTRAALTDTILTAVLFGPYFIQ